MGVRLAMSLVMARAFGPAVVHETDSGLWLAWPTRAYCIYFVIPFLVILGKFVPNHFSCTILTRENPAYIRVHARTNVGYFQNGRTSKYGGFGPTDIFRRGSQMSTNRAAKTIDQICRVTLRLVLYRGSPGKSET